jgi:hypothetical protein
LESLRKFKKIEGFDENAPNKFIIVGDLHRTTGDIVKERKISFEEAEDAFGLYRITYLEVNSKTSFNMEHL